MMNIDFALTQVRDEVERATSKFGPFNSPHEGYAVILEELDELWDEIKDSKSAGTSERQMSEAIQVAAMAVRFLMDQRIA
jgi:hypothetical protein